MRPLVVALARRSDGLWAESSAGGGRGLQAWTPPRDALYPRGTARPVALDIDGLGTLVNNVGSECLKSDAAKQTLGRASESLIREPGDHIVRGHPEGITGQQRDYLRR